MIRRWLALTYYLYALRPPPCSIFILTRYRHGQDGLQPAIPGITGSPGNGLGRIRNLAGGCPAYGKGYLKRKRVFR